MANMNEEILLELKNFIALTVTQAVQGVATKEDLANFATKEDLADFATKEDLNKLENKIIEKMDNGFSEVMSAIADTMTQTNEDVDERVENHSRRLRKLEHQLA
jgi:hypothetical protein